MSERFGQLSDARHAVDKEVRRLGHDDLVDDAILVASELAANAILHAGGIVSVRVVATDAGVRLEVHDRSRLPPLLVSPSADAMTGRGLQLVAAIASRWGFEPADDGKCVFAELSPGHLPQPLSPDDLLEAWDDAWDDLDATVRSYHVSLGHVPTDLLVAAKTHVDNIVRELTLASAGAVAGTTAMVPPHLAALIAAVTDDFAAARLAIKRQALAAARRGDDDVELELDLPATAADAGERYLEALDQLDAYSRAARVLTIETPPQHRVFRHWYVGELVAQLRALAAGEQPPAREPFVRRLLREIDDLVVARRASEASVRLYDVAVALSRAATPEDIATVVLEEGVAALGASGGTVLLASLPGGLVVPGSVGYSDDLVARLRAESADAQLPAAAALRTGQPVWLESRPERDERFPELADFEPESESMCALPLIVAGRRFGALRFSFRDARLFGEDERRFVLALAAQTAQALDRARLAATIETQQSAKR